jgi:hypothetical protein
MENEQPQSPEEGFATRWIWLLSHFVTEQTGGRSWCSRIFRRAYGILFGAWIGYWYGWWIPGGCFAIVSLIPGPGTVKREWWHPLSLVTNIAFAVGFIWIVHKYGLWIPTGCVVAAVLLLRGTSGYRKSFSEYLKRPRVVAAMPIALVAVAWASRHPFLWSIVAPIVVLILLFGDAWVYTPSREEPLALSHPQS